MLNVQVFAHVRHEFQSDKFKPFGELHLANFCGTLSSLIRISIPCPIGIESAGSSPYFCAIFPGYYRRWRVERLFACLHSFRRIVTRYEYHIENFLGMVRLGCMRIMLRYF